MTNLGARLLEEVVAEPSSLSVVKIAELARSLNSDVQWLSLLVQLDHKLRGSPEFEKLINTCADHSPSAHAAFCLVGRCKAPDIKKLAGGFEDSALRDACVEAVFRIEGKVDVGECRLRSLIAGSLREGQLLPMTLVLAKWASVGMRSGDIRNLTRVFVASGETIDLREHADRIGIHLVRRYPTGAVSEKIALILPSLIAAARKRFNMASQFFVARALSFTGGTRDKLSCLSGFSFPTTKEEMSDLVFNEGVAMCSTSSAINPADRLIYDLRSRTATVKCEGLIIASIASKHLAVPAHLVALDLRYGACAFNQNRSQALGLGMKIGEVLNEAGIATLLSPVSSFLPDGISIGGYCELMEAIEVMKPRSSWHTPWSSLHLGRQRARVLAFFGKMLSSRFNVSEQLACDFGEELFESGVVLNSFVRILRAHGTADYEIAVLLRGLGEFLLRGGKVCHVYAHSVGRIDRIDFVRVSHAVNSAIPMSNEGTSPKFGLCFRQKIGSLVGRTTVLADVFMDSSMASTDVVRLLDEVRKSFGVCVC